MILTNDSSTSKDPLVICYCCWSRAVIKVNLRFYLNKDECKIPHSSSSFTLLRQAIKEKFEKLEKTEITDLYFEYFHGNSKKREIVENEFHFNMLVNNIQLNNKQEHTINYLKVQVKGKKVYGNWKIKEVAKIYNDAFTSVETLQIQNRYSFRSVSSA
ncbi:unnamed protein product [Rhizophagus irregularis]|uniref:Uncharacterized protein n=1 Tax=Rhizophagus irregularis TaxID=588596 RepID=A0A916EHZ4_9GLOM|nr:unnamed protein product [Rhizophagus irregularis]CAB5389786.1 unnamed protein product [Rhizophagus irregularis]